ncbi:MULTISPECIES: hypothetical protein [unclassified Thioalkalivibrio]|uniref:virion core protein, T7 gp14 family n=1 Tax=unclassified Thioalkalivibrio TaxID=2621013 RepID=UPI00037CC810|nr:MULTISPECIES: hypothetical protein [unclassified Thioalkalivibrio]
MIIPILTGIMSVGSAVVQHQQQSAHAKMQDEQHKANIKNSQTAMRDSYEATQRRMQQEDAAAGEAAYERSRQRMQEMGSFRAAAADSGVEGISLDRIMEEIAGTGSRDITNIGQNRDWAMGQLGDEMNAHRSTAMGRMNMTAPGIGPSTWGTAFQIGAGVTNSYNSYTQRTGNDPVGNRFGGRRNTSGGAT